MDRDGEGQDEAAGGFHRCTGRYYSCRAWLHVPAAACGVNRPRSPVKLRVHVDVKAWTVFFTLDRVA